MTRRALASAALVAGLAAHGSQAPAALAPTAPPRALVAVGSLRLAPDTRLAFDFRQPCADGRYALAQATPGQLDPRVVRIEVKLTGPGLAAPFVVPFTRADFGDACAFNLQLGELPLGSYDVAIEMLDAGGKRVASGLGKVGLQARDVAYTVPVQCDFRTGGLVVCLGATCPSTPPASPTPTPSPGPTVGPAPNPAAFFERVHGLHADDRGTVYLFGLRPSPWPDAYAIGRTVAVAPGGAMQALAPARPGRQPPRHIVYDHVLYEGDITARPGNGYESFFAFLGLPPNRASGSSANASFMRLDTGAQTTRYNSHDLRGDFLRPWGASASFDVYSNNQRIIATGPADPARAAAYAIGFASGTGLVLVDRLGLVGNRAQAVERPLSLVYDRRGRAPVWACKRGILTAGATPTAEPIVLVPRPVYDLAKVSETRRELLFTTYEAGDPKVYHVDLDTTTPPAAAFTFTYGAPHRIERGADGFFYVLLAEPPLPFDLASGDPYMHEFPGKRQVRVVRLRFDPATRTLGEPRLVVNSFDSPQPSW